MVRENGIDVDGVVRDFGNTRALDEVSFGVRPGRMTGFVGANGAGKTTTMRIIMGVLSPDAGQVRWQGEPLTAEQRRTFGYMPEERGLYPKMRVADQLGYLARLHGQPRRGGPSRRFAARAARPRWPQWRHVGDAVARQPAAGPGRRRARS